MMAVLSVFTTASGWSFIVTLTFAVGERDFLDAADFHAGHFDVVADLQFLRGVEQGVEVVAAAQHFHAAEGFHDGPGGEHHQDHKNAELGFE